MCIPLQYEWNDNNARTTQLKWQWWILVKVHKYQPTGWSFDEVGWQCIIRKAGAWIIVDNECQAPITLTTSFVDFKMRNIRVVTATNEYNFRPYPTIHALLLTQNSVPFVLHFCTLTLYIIYCWTWSRPEYGWNICHWKLSIQESVKQLIKDNAPSMYVFNW